MRRALLSFVLISASFGQSATFEVASIKRASWPSDTFFAGFTAGAGSCGKTALMISGTRVTIQRINVCGLIRLAYDMEDYRISGVPKELVSPEKANYFDVDARAAGASLNEDEARAMLKAMLANRFQLKLHKEMKELPVYALIVSSKGAPKLSTQPICDAPPKVDPNNRTVGMTVCKPTGSMAQLANDLATSMDRAVVDKTGLAGLYAFSVRWGIENIRLRPNPDVFTAVQEQLGLKLDPQKAAIDALVIDHADKPSEN